MTPDVLPGGADLYVPLTTRAVLVGPAFAVLSTRVEMVLGAIATLAVAWRWARREVDPFGAAVATACFAAGPCVVAALTSGDRDALDGWALLLLPLCAGPAALVAGIVIGVGAPSLAVAAILPVLLGQSGDRPAQDSAAAIPWLREVVVARRWPLAGWALANATAAAFGGGAWSASLGTMEFGPFGGESGWLWGLPLILFFLFGDWRTRGLSVAALVILSAVVSPGADAPGVVMDRTWWLLPPLLVAVVTRSVRDPAVAVLGGATLLAVGWGSVVRYIPLGQVDLSFPDTVADVIPGTVLDLPTTRSANRRAQWLGAFHGQPRAANADGFVPVAIQTAADQIFAGTCPDLAALGIAQVLARREEATRDLSALVSCLGPPLSDDGRVGLWATPPKVLPVHSPMPPPEVPATPQVGDPLSPAARSSPDPHSATPPLPFR